MAFTRMTLAETGLVRGHESQRAGIEDTMQPQVTRLSQAALRPWTVPDSYRLLTLFGGHWYYVMSFTEPQCYEDNRTYRGYWQRKERSS